MIHHICDQISNFNIGKPENQFIKVIFNLISNLK